METRRASFNGAVNAPPGYKHNTPSIRNRAVCSKVDLLIGTFDVTWRAPRGTIKCTILKGSLRVYWGLYIL